ncbi:MAG: efflux RND transporter permease subunit [Treponema sp.]|nr:efflux RND transporter permease subunit [Treponema sp.]
MKGLMLFFTRRPVTVIMIMAAVCIAAVFAFTVLPLDRLPELTVPRVTVETVYPGMAAGEIRSLVTIPVEDAFSSVKGLERIQSVSRDGSSLVRLDFRWGVDPMAASALVREAVDAVYPSLPQGVKKPAIRAGDPGTEPHAVVAVYSLSDDKSFARRFADYELRSKLRRIDGAGSVLLAGGETNEGHLRLDVPRLAALGLSPPEFAQLLSVEITDIPAGNAREGQMELVVVSSGRPGGIEELSALTLPSAPVPLRITDTGEIKLEAGPRKSVFAFNGKEAAALEIFRRPGADPVRLSRDIRKAIDEAGRQFSHNVEITLVRDLSPSLIKSMKGLAASAALGAAAVIAVLLVFIRRLRTSLLAALSIPVSAAAGICILAVTGRTLNSMSLGGLALGIGLVSDIAVIMLDLLNRHFDAFPDRPSPEDITGRAASIAGSGVSSTLTTAVVFVPVIFLPGPLGGLFGDTAAALVASIIAGWLYAQFCIPSLYRFSFKPETGRRKKPALLQLLLQKFHYFIRKPGRVPEKPGGSVEGFYRKALAPVLRGPGKWYITAGLASLAGALLLLARPAVFYSPDAAEEVLVSVEFDPGTVLESIGAYGAELSGSLQKIPCVKTAYGRAGAEDEDINRRAQMDYRREELVIRCLLERGVKPAAAVEIIRDAVQAQAIPFEHSVYLPGDRTESLLGLSSVLTYAVRGSDREEGRERAEIIKSRLQENGASASDLRLRPAGTRPELRLYPNREAAAHLGVSAADLAGQLYVMNEGLVAASLEIEGRPLDIRVSGNPGSWNISRNFSLDNIPVKAAQGKTVFLGSLGRIERLESEAALARLDRSDVIYMDIPQEKTLVKAAGKTGALFPWFFRADESVFSRYRNALLLNIALAVLLIYMTMGAQFESFLLPLILMLTIPFSLAGAGPALLLFNSRLDSGAVLGLTALFGLVVNNGLILFEICDERIRMGLRPALAVYSGASTRLRPVLVTALTTVFALLPVALNPLGSAQKSMAAAMLGGLAVSTLLSLFLLPPVFARFFTWRERH